MFQGQPLIRFWDSFFHHYYILLLFIIFMWSLYIYIYIYDMCMICLWLSRTWWTGKSETLQKMTVERQVNDPGRGTTRGTMGNSKKTSQLYAICHSWSLEFISYHFSSFMTIFHGWHCWHLSCPPVIFTTTLAAVVEQCGALRKENGESRERRCSGPATWCALQLWCALAGCWDDSEAWNGWKPLKTNLLNHVEPLCAPKMYIYL